MEGAANAGVSERVSPQPRPMVVVRLGGQSNVVTQSKCHYVNNNTYEVPYFEQ